MSKKVQLLRSVVEQRLTLAAEEIFGLFERTIAEYEEELCRTKEENHRQRQILDCVWNPTVLIHKTDHVQPSLTVESVVKDELPPEQQKWTPTVDQEEPEPTHIKEELEELWPDQEAYITKFLSVPVNTEDDDDEEKVKSSQLNQSQTEENKEEANKVDCGGSEASSSFHPHRHLQRKSDEQNEDCEETEDSDEDQTLKHKPESKLPTNSSTEHMRGQRSLLDQHMETHTDLILLGGQRSLDQHMDTHTGHSLGASSERQGQFFQNKYTRQDVNSPRDTTTKTTAMMMKNDMGVGEKRLFRCSVCSKSFWWESHLEVHMMSHTGEKPFKCLLCHKSFGDSSNFKRHMRVHTGERPFSCTVCHKRFTRKHHLQTHMKIHSRT